LRLIFVFFFFLHISVRSDIFYTTTTRYLYGAQYTRVRLAQHYESDYFAIFIFRFARPTKANKLKLSINVPDFYLFRSRRILYVPKYRLSRFTAVLIYTQAAIVFHFA